MIESRVVGVAGRLLLRGQSGIEGVVGMIFMSEGSAEQGKDAIARRLDNVALIAVDRIHHQLPCEIDEGTGIFEVEVFNQCGGTFR